MPAPSSTPSCRWKPDARGVTACIQKDSLPETAPFSHRLLRWWKVHGRHDLPWQRERTPYRVWVAEIMLQQTQVGTVIPYFLRFMKQFPDLQALARADQIGRASCRERAWV